jgi:hypothetical protein
MAVILYRAGIALLVVIVGCVDVPEAPRDPADTTLDAAAGAQLAIDGGWWARPQTGEPYLGPECDTSGAAGAGAADSTSGADAGFAPWGAGQGADVGAGAGSAGDMPGAPARRPSTAGDLVITELMSNPEAVRDDAGEWFELHNPAAAQVFELAGCAIDDGGAAPRMLAGPLRVDPGAFVAVARSEEVGFVPDWTMTFSLGNAADVLALICDGVVIDRVAYGAGFPLTPGASMALDPAALDAHANDGPEPWCVALLGYGAERGSPGAPNPPCADADAGHE